MGDIHGLVLIPPSDIHQGLITLSQAFLAVASGDILLCADCQPHVTVIQTDASLDLLQSIGLEYSTLWSERDSVTFAGLSVVPGDDGTWIEVSVLKSDRLVRLQAEIADRLRAHGSHLINGIGDSYRPHATVGLVRTITSLPALEPNLLRSSSTGWNLVVTKLGPHYTVPSGMSLVSAI